MLSDAVDPGAVAGEERGLANVLLGATYVPSASRHPSLPCSFFVRRKRRAPAAATPLSTALSTSPARQAARNPPRNVSPAPVVSSALKVSTETSVSEPSPKIATPSPARVSMRTGGLRRAPALVANPGHRRCVARTCSDH